MFYSNLKFIRCLLCFRIDTMDTVTLPVMTAVAFLLACTALAQEIDLPPTSISSNWYLSVEPTSLENIIEYVPYHMNVTLNYNGTTALASDAVFTVSVKTTNDVTLELSSTSLRFSAHDVMNDIHQNLSVTGQVIGYVHLNFLLESGGIVTTPQEILPPFLVTVVRFSNTLDSTFTIIIAAVAIINTVNMGCGLDLNIVKQNILRPVGPVVGFISQFTFMPLVSFTFINSKLN